MPQGQLQLPKERVPVTLITGFLGSGKTTLLNYILNEEHGEKIAVVVNEFGEIGIDDKLIVKREDGVVEMTNGCICCEAKNDTAQVLLQLIEQRVLGEMKEGKGKYAFDRVVIETTGLANPLPLIRMFMSDPSLKRRYELDAVVVLVDAFHLEGQLEKNIETKEQIACADVILLNKTDLVGEAQLLRLGERIRALNPVARIIQTQRSRVPLDDILHVHGFDMRQLAPVNTDSVVGHDHAVHDSQITSLVLSDDRPLLYDKVQRWIGEALLLNASDLLRYKGILYIKDMPQRFVFQGVHSQFENITGSVWGSDDEKKSEVVLIGRNLDEDYFRKTFKECVSF